MTQSAVQTSCILGGPGYGKTSQLIQDALKASIKKDAQPLFVCASKRLAENALSRFQLAGADNVRVATPTELALEVLSCGQAQKRNRQARLLDAFEEREVLDSLKQVGTRGRRLKELTGFLLRGISDLSDDDRNWLITAEEVAVMKVLRESLEQKGGYLACEAPAAAFRALQEDEGLRTAHSYALVYCDDFLSLGRASQLLVRMLAERRLVVACDDMPGMNAHLDEDFPNEGGLEELMRDFPQTEPRRLESCLRPDKITSAIEALRAGNTLACVLETGKTEDEGDALGVRVEPTIDAEMGFIAKTVSNAICAGVDPKRMLVAGTNRVWRANASRAISLSLTDAENKVEVADPQDAYGRDFDLVVFGGVVGGLIPTHGVCSGETVGAALKRAKCEDVRALCACLASTRQMIISAFQSCSLECAERLDLNIEKIHSVEGKRIARIRTSPWIEQGAHRCN